LRGWKADCPALRQIMPNNKALLDGKNESPRPNRAKTQVGAGFA